MRHDLLQLSEKPDVNLKETLSLLSDSQISIIDPWQSSSLLHKAIRRGDQEVALLAALRFFQLRGNAIWRRLLIIAVEDVGIASIEAVWLATLACDAKWRGGTDKSLAVIASVVRCLTNAAKDRSTDYLICAARKHPTFEAERCLVGGSPIDARIAMAVNMQLPLTMRGIAAWYASGVEARDEQRVGGGNLIGLLDSFADAGVPRDILDITLTACRRTREPLCIMLPVLWMEAFLGNTKANQFIRDHDIPTSVLVNGLPLYCFDKHTRIGKLAISRFATKNTEVADVFGHFIPDFKARDAVAMAAYYVDAAPISRQFMWDGCEELERIGTESDFWPVGAPPHAVNTLIAVVGKNLNHLNDLRRELFTRQLCGKD